MQDINQILSVAIQGGASDVHLKAGLPPLFRINGGLVPLRNGPRLSPQDMRSLLSSMASREQLGQFDKNYELDFAYSAPKLGRFRVNAFYQQQRVGLVLRVINSEIKSIDELNLPVILKKIADAHHGLVLVTGATGSGKSTTLAALINEVNITQTSHVMTVEDPIEYIHRDKRSVINQREVGQDTRSFANALRAALRQDPDVILVGEMRDIETVETGLTAAETGHLVMSTLHTTDAPETVNRIISLFPPHQHDQIRHALSTSLNAIISQRLVKRADGRGRIAALEILLATARVRELIGRADGSRELLEVIAQGHSTYSMQTFDQALMIQLKRGVITKEEALNNCSNKDDFLLKLAGIESTSDGW